MSKDATYKVSYFPAKGGGEILRLVLVAAGKRFDDERIDKEDWIKLKASPGCPPAKQMPFLTIKENGKETVLCQSNACARYLAKKFGLFGSSPEQTALIDEAYECVIDSQTDIVKVAYTENETDKASAIEKFKNGLQRLNDYVKARSDMYGKNGFIIGESITIADLQLYNLVDQVSEKMPGMFTSHPNLTAVRDVVKSNPKIAKWIDDMPKSKS